MDAKALETPIPHIPVSKREIIGQVLDTMKDDRLSKFEAELLTLGDGALAKQRRKFLDKEIANLKKQQK